MKIVIEIDDDMYKSVANNDAYVLGDVDWILLENAIANGTPLPEHHGRLGDLDALEAEMINGIKAGNYEEGYEEYAHINDMDDCIECVRYEPTIIERSDSE